MSFLKRYNEYLKLVNEQDEQQPATDAAAPAPNAAAELQPAQATEQKPMMDQGYTNLVKLLAKSLAMNIPIGDIDAEFTTSDITPDNAIEMQESIENFLKESEVKEDNIERLKNPNYLKFVNSITPKNFQSKLKHLIKVMEKQDPSVKELFNV